MADNLTPAERSRVMSRVRAVDARPEIAVRRLLHRMGYRYRLHYSELPGNPDIVFPKRRKVVFVNGCFWHRHHCRNGQRLPRSHRRFWRRKLEGNKARDQQNLSKLRKLGYAVRIIWECEVAQICAGQGRRDLRHFLGPPLSRTKKQRISAP